MTLFIILFVSLFLCYIHYVCLKVLRVFHNEGDLFIFSFSYLFTLGSVSLQLFFYSLFYIPWEPLSLLLPWLVLFTFLLIRKRGFFSIKLTRRKISLEGKIWIFFLVSLLLFVGIESIIRPAQAWDAWSSWLLKSKIFYFDKEIVSMFSYFPSDYPIGVSLFGTFFYTIMHRVDDRAVLILFFLFYVFLIILFYSFVKKYVGRTNALFSTFLLASLQNVIRHGGRFEAGMADLALAYAMLCAAVLLIRFFRSRNYKTLFLLECAIAICGFVKYEGIVFSIVLQIIIFYLIVAMRKGRYIFLTLPWFFSTAGWALYKYIYAVPAHYIFGNGLRLERLPFVLSGMTNEFFNIKNWNLLWIVFLLAIAVYHRRIKKEALLLFLVIVCQWFIYLLVYLISPLNPREQLPSTIDRLYLHLSPLALLSVILLAGSSFDLYRSEILRSLRRVTNHVYKTSKMQ